LIFTNQFTDLVSTSVVYMVRAVHLEVSASGSYYNASEGVFANSGTFNWTGSTGVTAVGGTDNFFANFAGIPGAYYTVEYNTVLSGTGWTKLSNPNDPTGNYQAPATNGGFGIGVFQILDPVMGNSQRYYRTVYPGYY
jgi:hypothetical protein